MYEAVPLSSEILVCFMVTICLLYRYADFLTHNSVIIASVLISWFFSFLVIFLLPADLTSTAYRQCIHESQNNNTNVSTQTPTLHLTPPFPSNSFSNELKTQSNNSDIYCQIPWNYVGDTVLRRLWRFIYWSSQFLTWLVLPLMQSYSMVGDFSASDKLRSALRANFLYYSIFGAIFSILFVYLVISNSFDFGNVKVILVTSANTWGLFLLVVLLGYGLIELPRSMINRSMYSQSLNEMYFRVGIVNAEKLEAESSLDEALEEIMAAYQSIGTNHHLRPYLDKIVSKCPVDWQNRSISFRRQNIGGEDVKDGSYSMQSMANLNLKVIKSVHYYRQISAKWHDIIREVIEWEDISKNQVSGRTTKLFVSTLPRNPTNNMYASFVDKLYTPQVEWYWKCFLRVWLYRLSGWILAAFSLAVVWSEATFLFKSPVLSIFAVFINGFQQVQEYVLLEIFSVLSMGYLACCAFYTVFHVKIFNIYYLAPEHQTDEYSLIFSGLLLCRLAAPLCLNYLCLVQRDSQIITQKSGVETSFTSIMGHLELIPIVSKGLNIILPLCISCICLALYFNIGVHLLHKLGFEQYIEGDESTGELVQIGRNLIKREKIKLVRSLEIAAGGAHSSQVESQMTGTDEMVEVVTHNLPTNRPHTSQEDNVVNPDSPLSTSSNSSKSSLLHKSSRKPQVSDRNSTSGQFQNKSQGFFDDV